MAPAPNAKAYVIDYPNRHGLRDRRVLWFAPAVRDALQRRGVTGRVTRLSPRTVLITVEKANA